MQGGAGVTSEIIAETDRTTIHRITLTDAPFVLRLVNSPEWLRYIGDRGVTSEREACDYLERGFLRSYSDYGFGYYAVKTRSDVPIGICGFLKKPELSNPDFGFALLPDFCGQGYAFEACRAVLEFGVREFGFLVLDAVTMPENRRSISLLEKLGFECLDETVASNESRLLLYRWRAA